jgi:hypothetical protein
MDLARVDIIDPSGKFDQSAVICSQFEFMIDSPDELNVSPVVTGLQLRDMLKMICLYFIASDAVS